MAAYEKVIVYIDGFNLYFGMKQAGLQECKWLDLSMLISKLLRENQHVLEIKYFTSNVSKNPSKQKSRLLILML